MEENKSAVAGQNPEELKKLKQEEEQIVMEIAEVAKETPKVITKESSTGNAFLDTYNRLNSYVTNIGGVKINDRLTFFELLATMINAGMPLVKSLKVLTDQFTSLKFKKIINDLASKVERGRSLSDAMGDYPSVFEDAQTGMVAAAEASGKMNTVLRQVAVQLEKKTALTSKVKGAMIYPIAIFTLLIGVITIMLTVVLPKMTDIFTASGKELPDATKMLLAVSDFALHSWWKVLIGAAATIFFVNLWGKTPNGRYALDNIKIHLPLFGALIRKVCLARFTRSLSSMLGSGVPIVKSLQINAELVGNAVYREAILLAAEDVQRGIPMGETLNGNEFLFPSMLVSMISVGEQTAEIHNVAEKVADFYEQGVDNMVGSLSKMLEPMIMVVIGLTVGGLVAAIMGPIMSIGDIATG